MAALQVRREVKVGPRSGAPRSAVLGAPQESGRTRYDTSRICRAPRLARRQQHSPQWASGPRVGAKRPRSRRSGRTVRKVESNVPFSAAGD